MFCIRFPKSIIAPARRGLSTLRVLQAPPPRGTTVAEGSVLSTTSSKKSRWMEIGQDFPSSRFAGGKRTIVTASMSTKKSAMPAQVDALYDLDLGMAWPSSRLN